MSLFVDANIPMYAEGRDSRFKAPSAEFMLAVARRQVDAVSDVEVLQEILHRYRAVGRQSHGFVVFQAFATTVRIFHSVVLADLWECRAILRRHRGLQPRDRDSRRRHAPQRDSDRHQLRSPLRRPSRHRARDA